MQAEQRLAAAAVAAGEEDLRYLARADASTRRSPPRSAPRGGGSGAGGGDGGTFV